MPQPLPRIERLPFPADLEIELRPGAAAAVAGLGNGLTGGNVLADGLVEPGVVAVEAHVAAAVIDDDEQSQPGQPIGVHHPAAGYRAHGRIALGSEQVPLPLETPSPHLPVAFDDAAGDRPGEPPA